MKKVLKDLSLQVAAMQTELRVLAENSESVAKEVGTMNTDFKNVAFNYDEGVDMKIEIEYLKEKLSRYEQGWEKEFAEKTQEELGTLNTPNTQNDTE